MNDAKILGNGYLMMARMCHGLCHGLGLYNFGEQDENLWNRNTGSCMDYTACPQGGICGGQDYGPNNLYPSDQDYEDLYYAYLNSGNRKLEANGHAYFKRASPSVVRRGVLPNATSQSSNNTSIQRQFVNADSSVEGRSKNVTTVFGTLVSEVHLNGAFQKKYERYDEKTGIVTVSIATGLDG